MKAPLDEHLIEEKQDLGEGISNLFILLPLALFIGGVAGALRPYATYGSAHLEAIINLILLCILSILVIKRVNKLYSKGWFLQISLRLLSIYIASAIGNTFFLSGHFFGEIIGINLFLAFIFLFGAVVYKGMKW